MIEGRALISYAFIRERFQESHDRNFIERAKAGALKIGVEVHGWKVSGVAIEIHHLRQVCLAAVQEKRSGQLNVAQAGCFDRSANGDGRAGRHWSSGDLSHGGKL